MCKGMSREYIYQDLPAGQYAKRCGTQNSSFNAFAFMGNLLEVRYSVSVYDIATQVKTVFWKR